VRADKKLKVVVVGCGGMSGAWLSVATKERGLEVAGLTDLRREAAEKRAEEFKLSKDVVFDTLDEALEAARPDVVFDVTTPESHHEVTLKALAAGCHVCGEKPLADSMDHAREMVEAARRAGRIYAVMQNRRYIPSAVALIGMLRAGAIGDITTVNVDFYIGAHFGGFRDEMDHPLLLDMAIHTFDQARQITDADPVSVYCTEFNPRGSWYRGAASAMCIFEMTGGIIFNYRGSWCAEGLSTPWAGTWRIVGTRGSAAWAEDRPYGDVVNGDQGFIRPMRRVEAENVKLEATGHEGCIREFLRAVRTGGRPQTVCDDNIKSLGMVFGAIRSAAAGRGVRVEV